ncbi:MAG TPA: type II secretion system protein [Clostridiales bacterium]|nr:type II secretion system protein [Clostridiales bacterium]
MERANEIVEVQESEVRGKKKNKGFSLVELIIVIAIMAILVGIVGTQVLPYIEKSRQAKDYQVISSYLTAATTAYTANAATITSNVTVTFDTADLSTLTSNEKLIYNEVKELTAHTDMTALKNKLESKAGKNLATIAITIDITNKTITVDPTQGDSQYDHVFKDAVGKL